MCKINEQLRIFRKSLHMTQQEFGERLGVNKATISRLEKKINNVTEQMTKSICREFNVNEDWLRNGSGEMYKRTPTTFLDEIAIKYNIDINEYKALLWYLQLDQENRNLINTLIENLGLFNDNKIKDKIENETIIDDDIKKAMEQYLEELILVKKTKILSASRKSDLKEDII